MSLSINPDRLVPVKEDLTTPYNQLEILRGWEKMHRVDKELADGVSFVEGEWAVLGSNGKLTRPSATPVPNTYLVFQGTNRFDSYATGQASIVMASQIVARTTKYDDSLSYAAGDYLTVKDLGGGEAVLTKQAGSEPKLAMVVTAGPDFLEFQTLY